MTNVTNINPEQTLIYKELKSKFEVSYPELWKEVSENLKQVIETNNYESIAGFKDGIRLSSCFIWEDSKQGHTYWSHIGFILNNGDKWW